MQIVEQPWARVRERVPVPDRATRVQLEALDDLEFSELLRSHLLPPNGDRDRWHALWAVLSDHPDLAHRTLQVLGQFLSVTEELLGQFGLDPAVKRRARRFATHCRDARNRLEAAMADEDEEAGET